MGAGARIVWGNGSGETLDPRGHLASFLRGHFLLKNVLRMVSLCLNYVRCERRHGSTIAVTRERSALT